jgi:hypothetical protein
MKKIFLLSLLFSVVYSYAQVPFKFNYQTVVRDAKGKPVVGNVSLRIKIYDAASGGATLYQEEHTNLTSNDFGLINLQIGTGTVSVGTSLASLDWATGAKWIETEMNTGTGFLVVGGRSQLVAVPYSIQAQNADIAKKAQSMDIKYATTGVGYEKIVNTQVSNWVDVGQIVTVPDDGKYLILCTARAAFAPNGDVYAWEYRIFNSSANQEIGHFLGNNDLGNLSGQGDITTTAHVLTQLNKNDNIKVQYFMHSYTNTPTNWYTRDVNGATNLSVIKIAD